MAIRIRKLGHSHKLTVPTHRKGMGVAQAAQQVAKNKATVQHPGADFNPYSEPGDIMRSGGTIHIKKANRGKFNATKARTGKSTEELTHSKNAATRKRAIFAQNARKWHHHEEGGYIDHDNDFIQDMMEKAYGGWIKEFTQGGSVAAARKKPGGSNVGKKTFADGSKRHGPYAGTSGGAPKGSYPIPDIGHARAALRLAHHAPNPAGIRAKVLAKYPQLKKAEGGYINEYEQGGRTINPAMGGYAIGGRFAYPPMAPYPPEYGFGGVLQSFAPFMSLIPGIGPAASMAGSVAGGMIEGASKNKEQEEALNEQRRQHAMQQAAIGQAGVTGNSRPTFSWGGRLPETMEPMSPSGLTMGHVPGYDTNSNYGGTNIPGKGWNYRTMRGRNEGVNWSKQTSMNVHRHTYPDGGGVDKAVTTVRNNRFIPMTERQFYDQAVKPVNDTLTWDQFYNSPATMADRSKYIPNSDYQIQQGKRGSTVNKGYLKYYQNNPVDMGTDITRDGLPIFRQPDKSIIRDMFPQAAGQYPMGGQINDNQEMQPVELEKQEVYQTPSGQMGQVNGPSHAEGGVDMELPENSFVWSDKLKTAKGTTFADEAARLGRMKAKYEKILRA